MPLGRGGVSGWVAGSHVASGQTRPVNRRYGRIPPAHLARRIPLAGVRKPVSAPASFNACCSRIALSRDDTGEPASRSPLGPSVGRNEIRQLRDEPPGGGSRQRPPSPILPGRLRLVKEAITLIDAAIG